ncbi:Hypp6310 [Branchiostoma lanceolatum]|uniref:Hypp6310 protein n=1 Tax=Branchiostoma lanceolatum TaxID=7740 RepID=A0A8K0E553_BRALA|nr:Hypp6310 [Branchiostoma lanceolatum]
MWQNSGTDLSDSSYEDDGSVCGICHQALRAPRTLSCRHVFCGTCLDDLDGRQSPLICPICDSPATQSGIKYIVRQPGKAIVGPSLAQAGAERQKSISKCSEHPQKRLASLEIASKESVQTTHVKRVDSKQRTEDFLKNLDIVENSVTENHLQTKQSINDEYEVLSQKLLNRRDVLLREVEDNLEHNMGAIAREREIAQNQLEELNKAQAIDGKKEKRTDKSRSNIAIPVLLQPSTTRFEAIDAHPESFCIGHVIIHEQDQGSEDGDVEIYKGDEDVGCFDALTNSFSSALSNIKPWQWRMPSNF